MHHLTLHAALHNNYPLPAYTKQGYMSLGVTKEIDKK